MRCVLVDMAPRRIDQRPVLKVLFEERIVRTEHSSARDVGQCDDMGIVGVTVVSHRSFFFIDNRHRVDDCAISARQFNDQFRTFRDGAFAITVDVLVLVPESTTDNQFPFPVPDPIVGKTVRIVSVTGEERGRRSIVIDDQAHG